MHRTKVRVAEDALDANTRSRRRTAPTSTAPAVTRRQPDERPGRGQDDAAGARARPGLGDVRRACSRATCRAAWTPTGSPRCTCRSPSSTPTPASAASATSTRTWCARRCRQLPLDEIDLLVIENVGNLVCPAEFRVGEDARAMVVLGHRGRGQAAQVPADVPHLRAGGGQQDRPAPAPRLRPRPLPPQPRRGQPRRGARCWSAPSTGEGVDGVPRLARGRCAERRDGRGRRDGGARPPTRRPCASCSRARTEAERERSSTAEAERLARLCHRMAERFARGGRLVALGRLAHGALGRPPRGRRVRAPGDRRQAGAAGDRRSRRGRRRSATRWSWSPSPTTSRSPSGRETGRERCGAARASAAA